jgi:hypothetical protein
MEFGLATTQKLSATIFIGNSGATCHMHYSMVGRLNFTVQGRIFDLQQLVQEDKTTTIQFELTAPNTPKQNGMVE